VDALRRFQLGNLGRYNLFLQSPRDFPPTGPDGLATRGGAWAFLRYVLDRDPAPDTGTLSTLGNSRSAGLDNVSAVIGESALGWMGDWSVAVLLDDLGVTVDPRFDQPSWNFRDLIPPLRSDNRFPLRLVEWPSATRLAFDLRPASTSHTAFALADGEARIEVTAPDREAGEEIRTWLVRTR
jgi:hypothetical protein